MDSPFTDVSGQLLTVNAGSSSIRFGLFKAEGATISALAVERFEAEDTGHGTRLREFLTAHGATNVGAVAHRVVHGGMRLPAACRIDAVVEREIEALAPFAPLHNPPALAWIRECRALLGSRVPQVAVFDTGFYADLPEVARAYAIPYALAAEHGIRRYGFHGLAHRAMWRRWCEIQPELDRGGRVISLQLGAGCSITATANGRPRDTSMGFSPLEGLMMATRSGDLDPGVITYLQRVTGMSAPQIDRMLNEDSGLAGTSGVSGDMRTLLDSNEPRARLAIDLYCYRARKYIGAYLAVLGGADAVLFGGGVGEHAPAVRERILAGMDAFGIRLNPTANKAAVGREAHISHDRSAIAVWVVPVDEGRLLAQEAMSLLSGS